MREDATLPQRLTDLRGRMEQTCLRAGRNPADVHLLAVTKGQPVSIVRAGVLSGLLDFGENYVQELVHKAQEVDLAPSSAAWHFIGHLQRNKIAQVLPYIDWLHTIDRVALVFALHQHLRTQPHDQPLSCLIQVNIGQEPQKHGCLPSELGSLLDAFAATQGHLVCKGLMCIPPVSATPEEARPYFRHLRALRDEHARIERPHVELRELSMGMSHDFEVAIEEGATWVRIGTVLFGPRAQKDT